METISSAPEIALLSSNARAKYFEDCLRALMLPRGMILHFRYRSKYVNPSLLTAIGDRSVIGKKVVVCYLFQTPSPEGKQRPSGIRPIREGKVVDATVVGPSVHLYFFVDGYPSGGDPESLIGNAVSAGMNESGGPYFVANVKGLTANQFSAPSGDASAFSQIIESFEAAELAMASHFGGALLDRDPLFMRIEGLYRRGKKDAPSLLSPAKVAEFSDRQRGYIINFDDPLELRIQFHQPSWSKVDAEGLSLELRTDPKHFANPETDRLDVASLYDQTEFYLLPNRDNVGWVSRLEIVPNGPAVESGINADRRIVAVPFQALVWSKPVFQRWLVTIASATSNVAAVLLSIISIIIALSKDSGTAAASGAVNTVTTGPSVLTLGLVSGLVIILILVMITGIVRSRSNS